MKILWISSLAWNSDNGYEYPVNGPGAVSGSCFEQSIIEGLESLGHSVDIICDYPYSDKFIYRKSRKWNHSIESDDFCVSSLNIKYASILHKEKAFEFCINKRIKTKNYDVAIAYLIHQPYLKALKIIKKKSPKTKTVLICPDLPNMMDMSLKQKRIKSLLKNIDAKRISKLYKYVDGYVLFSKYMTEKIPVYSKPWTVIEGVANVKNLKIGNFKKEKAIMHAGTLHKNIGIEQIVESMKYIAEKDLNLWIFGGGELEPYIKSAADLDSRIKYFGFVSRDELFEYEQKAMALINARNPDDEYTKYSFPSKTYEYLFSGTPFISTVLLGIPDEYLPYIDCLEDNNPKTIANKIKQIYYLGLDNKNEKAELVRNFILYEKNSVQQAEKLEKFIININQ